MTHFHPPTHPPVFFSLSKHHMSECWCSTLFCLLLIVVVDFLVLQRPVNTFHSLMPPPPHTTHLNTHKHTLHFLTLSSHRAARGRRRVFLFFFSAGEEREWMGDICHESLAGDPWHSGVPLLCMQGMLDSCTPGP